MPITEPYASVEEYRLARTSSERETDDSLYRQLLATSRYLDKRASQFFGKTDTAISRALVGDGSAVLSLKQDGSPGIATTTGLIVEVDTDNDGDFDDETDLVVADLLFFPLNALLDPEPHPFTEIHLTNRSAIGSFPRGQLVRVTATWGWPSVPELVWSTTIELTAIWIGESSRATARINELEQVVNTSPMAQGLVKRFVSAFAGTSLA